MIIDKKILPFLISENETIHNCLIKINQNKSKVLFTISDFGELMGSISDGDIRRWLLNNPIADLNIQISNIHNQKFTSAPITDDQANIERLLSSSISIVPLVDKLNRVVGIARKNLENFVIGDFTIGENYPVFVIAEIGNNHNGDYNLAIRLVDEAKKAGADCVKFQMRNFETLYRTSYKKDSTLTEDLGSEYVIDLLKKFQLSNQSMLRVFDYCYKIGIIPLCTPWDEVSVGILDNYGLEGFKVASADLTNHSLLSSISKTKKPIICSTGMSRESEIIESVHLLKSYASQYALLHCNSTYPSPFKDINLSYIKRLSEIGDCVVGYSGHERGTSVSMASIGFGARIIERHITLDRNMEGNDHRVSLLPEEFRNLVEGIREIEQSIGSDKPRAISQGELMNRETLSKSLVINCDLKKGDIITDSMIEIRSPGQGLQPNKRNAILNKKAVRNLKAGDFLFDSDLNHEKTVKPRNFKFKRKWGIPVRFHDFEILANQTNLSLIEFHLSYKDIDLNVDDYFKKKYNYDFVVHAPELFSGDHILDLCSDDKEYRERSIYELKRVANLARRLRKYFNKANKKTLIIVNVGGSSQDSLLPESHRIKKYELIAESLNSIDQKDIEFIPQTMPPFPWHFGGQRHHNIFVNADEILFFCKKYSYRICLDISHSKLACNHNKWSFEKFIEKVGKYSAHLHVVDAYGDDGEGVQIGEGEIDFPTIIKSLNKFSPNSSFIPEIWQGHKDNGAGFWYALERLEEWKF